MNDEEITLNSEWRELADRMTAEARQIVYRHETGFGRLGVICRQVQDDELWAYITIPGESHLCRSFTHWMKHIGSRSESYCWAALKASRELIDMVDTDLSEIGHDNVQTLMQIPQSIRRRQSIVSAARDMSPYDFLAKVQTDHPDLHLEKRKSIKLPESLHSTVETAMKQAEIHGAIGRIAQLEAIAEAALEYWEMLDMQSQVEQGDVRVQ